MIRPYHKAVRDSHAVVQPACFVYCWSMSELLLILYDVFWMTAMFVAGALIEGIATGIACAWLGRAESFSDDF